MICLFLLFFKASRYGLTWMKRRACLFVCVFVFLTSSSATRLHRVRVPRLTSDNFACGYTATERGDHDFCLSRWPCADTGSTSNEQAPWVGIDLRTSWSKVATAPAEAALLIIINIPQSTTIRITKDFRQRVRLCLIYLTMSLPGWRRSSYRLLVIGMCQFRNLLITIFSIVTFEVRIAILEEWLSCSCCSTF